MQLKKHFIVIVLSDGLMDNSQEIKEAILEGAIKNEYTDAFDFMVKKGIEIGLIPLAEHERK